MSKRSAGSYGFCGNVFKIDMSGNKKSFCLKVDAVKRTRSGLSVTGLVTRGFMKVNNRVYVCGEDTGVTGFLSQIWVGGHIVNGCYQNERASLNIVFNNAEYLPEGSAVHYVTESSQKTPSDKSVKTEEFEKNPTKESAFGRENMYLDSGLKDVPKAEKEFLRNLQICIAKTGVLAPTEAFLMDKIRISLGLSIDKATALIDKYVSRIPQNEAERHYFEAVAACLLDSGYLSENERYLLNNLRQYLNISESRSALIEKAADWDNV